MKHVMDKVQSAKYELVTTKRKVYDNQEVKELGTRVDLFRKESLTLKNDF